MAHDVEERVTGAIRSLRGIIADLLVVRASIYRENVAEEDLLVFEEKLCELLDAGLELRVPLVENPPSRLVRKLIAGLLPLVLWLLVGCSLSPLSSTGEAPEPREEERLVPLEDELIPPQMFPSPGLRIEPEKDNAIPSEASCKGRSFVCVMGQIVEWTAPTYMTVSYKSRGKETRLRVELLGVTGPSVIEELHEWPMKKTYAKHPGFFDIRPDVRVEGGAVITRNEHSLLWEKNIKEFHQLLYAEDLLRILLQIDPLSGKTVCRKLGPIDFVQAIILFKQNGNLDTLQFRLEHVAYVEPRRGLMKRSEQARIPNNFYGAILWSFAQAATDPEGMTWMRNNFPLESYQDCTGWIGVDVYCDWLGQHPEEVFDEKGEIAWRRLTAFARVQKEKSAHPSEAERDIAQYLKDKQEERDRAQVKKE
jgi:hypothetical protein